jgi:hypothetical protein
MDYDKAIETALERGEDPQEYVNRKTGHDEFQALLEKYWELLQEPTCDECDHKVSLHRDPHGCQYERGDALNGEVLVAQGPCSCKAHGIKSTGAKT